MNRNVKICEIIFGVALLVSFITCYFLFCVGRCEDEFLEEQQNKDRGTIIIKYERY